MSRGGDRGTPDVDELPGKHYISAGELRNGGRAVRPRDAATLIILRREGGVATSDVARVNQYLKHAIMNFEKMRNIAVYRTPRSLRSYTQVFLNSFPVLFGPYFAYLSATSYVPVGFFVAVLYSLVLVGLWR